MELAVELFAATGSLHIGAGRQRTGRGAAVPLRHFRLANGVLYPLAGVAEKSGAAHLDLRGPPGWGAGFLFGDIPVRGPPLELGRSERPTLRPLWSYGVIDDSTPVQQLR